MVMGEQCTYLLGGGGFGEGVQSRQLSPKMGLGAAIASCKGPVQGRAWRDSFASPREGGKGWGGVACTLCLGVCEARKMPTCLHGCKRRPFGGRASWGKISGQTDGACTRTPGGLSFFFPSTRAVSPSSSLAGKARARHVGASNSRVSFAHSGFCCDESSGSSNHS